MLEIDEDKEDKSGAPDNISEPTSGLEKGGCETGKEVGQESEMHIDS